MLEASPDPATCEDIDFDVLDGLASFHLRAVNLALSRDLDARLAGMEVAGGTGKITCLLLVDANPGVSASTLARVTLRDRAAITRILDRLCKAGLLLRERSKTEGRVTRLRLTESGRALARKVRAAVTAQSAEFFHDLDEAESETLKRLLRRVYRRVAGLAA